MLLAAYNFRQMQLGLIGSVKLQGHGKHRVYGIPYLQNDGIPCLLTTCLLTICVTSHYCVK